ncbi:MAG: hypothetical protein ABW086_14585 [Sedimenticola sp.]
MTQDEITAVIDALDSLLFANAIFGGIFGALIVYLIEHLVLTARNALAERRGKS